MYLFFVFVNFVLFVTLIPGVVYILVYLLRAIRPCFICIHTVLVSLVPPFFCYPGCYDVETSSIQVLYHLNTFGCAIFKPPRSGGRFRISSPLGVVARDKATYICPYSKTLARSTTTRGNVCPCDLWIDIAQARMSGTWNREACMVPFESVTANLWGGQRRVWPSVNSTNGHIPLMSKRRSLKPSLWST